MPETPAQKFEIVVDEADQGLRLDRWLVANLADLSRGRIQNLLASGDVIRSDTQSARTIDNASYKVKPGERYIVTVPAALDPEPLGEEIALNVLYEDDDLIVLNKPAGMVVHPSAGHETGTLVNALIAHCADSLSGIGGVKRPGIVHRLDKDTSGVMVAAKTDVAHKGLSEQFAAHSIERLYWAACWGAPRPREGTVNAPLARSTAHRKKRAVTTNGQHAITHYKVERTFGPRTEPVASLIVCALETGRTHQIRVHMTHIGHAVIGDPVYGRGRRVRGLLPQARAFVDDFGRQALHAGVLGFIHPVSGESLTFRSELPPDMNGLIDVLDAHPRS